MKKAWMMGVVGALHVLVVGALLMQGCGTTRPSAPPPAKEPPVVMPPVAEPVVPPPVIAPPVVVAPPVDMSTKVYTVKAGDSLSLIAKRFNVSTRDIVTLNKIKDPNKVTVGTKLTLPGYVNLNAPEPKRKPKAAKVAHKTAKPAVAAGGEYVVKAGDTLGHIAVRSGTTVKAIKEANNLTSDSLKIGQKLAMPKGGAAPAAVPAEGEQPVVAEGGKPAEGAAPEGAAASVLPESKPGELLHVVEAGQPLEAIALMYGVRVEELMKLNNLETPDVKVGQTLKIPPPAE